MNKAKLTFRHSLPSLSGRYGTWMTRVASVWPLAAPADAGWCASWAALSRSTISCVWTTFLPVVLAAFDAEVNESGRQYSWPVRRDQLELERLAALHESVFDRGRAAELHIDRLEQLLAFGPGELNVRHLPRRDRSPGC